MKSFEIFVRLKNYCIIVAFREHLPVLLIPAAEKRIVNRTEFQTFSDRRSRSSGPSHHSYNRQKLRCGVVCCNVYVNL
jgi:hypothetical protein